MRRTLKTPDNFLFSKSPRTASLLLEPLEPRLAPGDTLLAGVLGHLFSTPNEYSFTAATAGASTSAASRTPPREASWAIAAVSQQRDVPPLAQDRIVQQAPLQRFAATHELDALFQLFPSASTRPANARHANDHEVAPHNLAFLADALPAGENRATAPTPVVNSPLIRATAAGESLAALDSVPASGFATANSAASGCTGFAYDDFSTLDGLEVNGAAAQAGNRLRLTPAVRNQAGSAWFSTPQFVEGGFETTFQFQFSMRSNPNADGITFTIQNSEAGTTALGGAGGGLGYGEQGENPGIANSLAVEFDTFRNTAFGDPTANHISVHTAGTLPNSIDEAYSLGRTGALPALNNTQIHTAHLRYVPGVLEIYLDDLETPQLTVAVDLAATLSLNDGHAWVGFTSSTGSSWERHDLLNWTFSACPVCTELYYGDFSYPAGWWLNGDAAQEGDRLRLTPNAESRVGSAWLTARPVIQDGFWTAFQFQLTPQGRNGDGLAFVIQNVGLAALGEAGDGLGYAGENMPNSLAIEFDTFGNAETRDPNGNHISVQSRGTLPNSAHHDFSLGQATDVPNMKDGEVHTVVIGYAPGTLLVYLDDLETPRITAEVDLASLLNLTYGRAWVGFTASTGLATENHDILNWWFTNCVQ